MVETGAAPLGGGGGGRVAIAPYGFCDVDDVPLSHYVKFVTTFFRSQTICRSPPPPPPPPRGLVTGAGIFLAWQRSIEAFCHP